VEAFMSTISESFSGITEPRESNKRHKLIDIITIALCAVICGADTWEDIEEFGHTKKEWFERFLELPHGIPAHDTFARVFSSIDPKEFQQAFLSWVGAIQRVAKGIIAVDGKTVRHSRTKDSPPLHMVSAWAYENRMVLGQVKTKEKSNEITAIPELLQVLALEGCIVTIDAMGCQRAIAETIIKKKADYVFGLKGNQGTLHEDVKLYFEDSSFKDHPYDYYETIDGDHGRIETRRYWSTSAIDWLSDQASWKNLSTIVMVERERMVDGKTTISPALKVMPKPSPTQYEVIGVLRTVFTGYSILPFERTSPEYGKIMPLPILPLFDIWLSIYYVKRPHPKEALRGRGSRPVGIRGTWARYLTARVQMRLPCPWGQVYP
jgi:predicted transposase YbfD/YdcC